MNVQHLNQLNQHPLNQAALNRLRAAGSGPDPDLMHLLNLAHLGSLDQEGEPPEPDGPVGKVLADWGRPDSGRQAAALAELENSLTPDWVERANLDRITDQVANTLRGASSPPQS